MIWTVVTTAPGYDKELKQFINSFPEKNSLIIVFQNEAQDLIDQPLPNLFRVFSTRNLYEYGAWPAVQRLLDAGHVSPEDQFFMVHDTCRFTGGTEQAVSFLPDCDVFWAHDKGCHNICVTKGVAVKPVSDYLVLDTCMTKDRARDIEGKLHLLTKDFKNFFSTIGSEFIGDMSTDDRVCAHLPSVKLLKFFQGKLDDFVGGGRAVDADVGEGQQPVGN
jgi:hypothetical protein